MAETLAYPGRSIEVIMPYDFNGDTTSGGFGLTRHDWATRKPAYAEFATFAALLDETTGQGRVAAGGGVFNFRFGRGGVLVDVIWAQTPTTISIPSLRDGELYDLNGRRRTIGVTQGSLSQG